MKEKKRINIKKIISLCDQYILNIKKVDPKIKKDDVDELNDDFIRAIFNEIYED